MDEDDFFEDGTEVEIFQFMSQPQSRRFRGADLIVLGLDLIAGVSSAVSSSLMEARNRAALHANWRFDQDAFHEQAAQEIETLIAGEEQETDD